MVEGAGWQAGIGKGLLDTDNETKYPRSLLHATSVAGSPWGPGAVKEGIDADVDWPGRQRDLAQGRALLEGTLSNLGEVGRQRDVAQGLAIGEGKCSNLGKVGWQRDLA